MVYHFIAFLLLCAASITMLVMLTDRSNAGYRGRYRDRDYEPKLAAAVRPSPPSDPCVTLSVCQSGLSVCLSVVCLSVCLSVCLWVRCR